MGIKNRARQAAEEAAVAARAGAHVAADTARVGAHAAAGTARVGAQKAATVISDPATAEKAQHGLTHTGHHARRGLGFARRGLSTAIDRIDANVLADVVIKATALQEKANRSFRERHSPYRINELTLTASIPPSVQFAIVRIDDPDMPDGQPAIDSSDLMARPGAATERVLALDGSEVEDDEPQEADDPGGVAG